MPLHLFKIDTVEDIKHIKCLVNNRISLLTRIQRSLANWIFIVVIRDCKQVLPVPLMASFCLLHDISELFFLHHLSLFYVVYNCFSLHYLKRQCGQLAHHIFLPYQKERFVRIRNWADRNSKGHMMTLTLNGHEVKLSLCCTSTPSHLPPHSKWKGYDN